MLAIMTFNGGISIAIFIGIFVGNFLCCRVAVFFESNPSNEHHKASYKKIKTINQDYE